jgi:hypothetical protein
MARKYAVSLDLNKNELLNARIQNLSSAPSTPVSGQIYYNNVSNILFFYNGTEWTPASGSTEVIQDVIGAAVLGGTALTATYDDTAGTTTLSLNSTAVTAGSYGSTTKIPTFTVDAQGRLTAAGEADVATNLSISGDTGTDTVNLLTDTLAIAGGEGIDVAVTNNTITVSAEDATSSNKGVASFDATDFTVTTGAVTLNTERVQDIVGLMVSSNTESGIAVTYDDTNGKLDFDTNDFDITLTGDVTGTGTVTNLGNVSFEATIQPNSVALGTDTTGNYVATIAGTANEIEVSGSGSETSAVTIGLPDNVEITGNLQVGGNLNVIGTVNSVNTTQINIEDNKVKLNSNATGAPTADAGILVERGTSADAELLWNETSDVWQIGQVGGTYHNIARKYATTIGDGTATSYTITHGLATKDLTVQIFETNADYNQIEADVQHTSDSTVTVKFASAPTAGEYRVVIVG